MNIHTEWKKWKNLGENRAFFTHFFYSRWKFPVTKKFTFIYIHWAVCPRLNINTFFLLSSPTIHLLDMATDARCIASNVTPGQSAVCLCWMPASFPSASNRTSCSISFSRRSSRSPGRASKGWKIFARFHGLLIAIGFVASKVRCLQ